ncbi:MAG: YncE family protein, partial [Bryobacterales bacterium]|nr:YncE family protein [Bryobacterales bacterium]
GDSVRLVGGDKRIRHDFAKGSYPYHALPGKDGALYVSLWGASAVAVIKKGEEKPSLLPSDSHPTEMALSPDGKTLFVACANSTRVNVFDAASGKRVETIHCALHPGAPSGNTPSSLCLTPDGEILFVANADANNVAVFNVAAPGKSRPMGFIPTGWYPTSVRYDAAGKRLLVANGKGLASRANPHGPGPYDRS